MDPLGLIAAVTTAVRDPFVPIAFLASGSGRFQVPWITLALLVCFSATAGALAYRVRTRTGKHKRELESKAAELAMLRAVVANLPDLIYVKDVESRFLLANQGVADVMGAESSNALLGKTDFDFYPIELAEGFFADERKVVHSKGHILNQEEQVMEPSAEMRWILTTKMPLLDTAGKTVGIIGIGRNITPLKNIEAELLRAREELEFKAAHDSLTALLNRGAILDLLARELARGVREKSSTSVLLGDLDHFKNINDIHGHPVGDEVLCEVACRLERVVRPYDLVGRYGGEEFLIVLPNCGEPKALARADHLREAIASAPIATAHGPLPMTISIGVLVVPHNWRPNSAEIFRHVDDALYAAKASGRNRCCIAPPTIRQPAPL